jgi:DNA-binding transcriptional MerR regulator
MEGMWTIAELAAEAAAVLAADRPVVNGRVRDMPNERLIRWYTTIGLVDPPLARRGRTALYGHRHLLQLVAVKRRQAAGLSIADIQAELTGAPDSTLATIAELPTPENTRPAVHADRFWTRPTTPAAPTTAAEAAEADASAGTEAGARAATAADASAGTEAEAGAEAGAVPAASTGAGAVEAGRGINGAVVQGVRLEGGVTLLLDDAAPLDADEVAVIAAAARPLLDALTRLGRHPGRSS